MFDYLYATLSRYDDADDARADAAKKVAMMSPPAFRGYVD